MSMLDTAMSEFGVVVGFQPDDFAGRDHVAFEIEGIGELHVEKTDEYLIVCLSRPLEVGVDKLSIYRQALRSVHFENSPPASIQVALSGESLIFLARYAGEDCDRQTLEASIEILAEMHDNIAS
ncbi:MAG: hypothetical protein AAGC81_13995 [Pseudomonadota bacterium]